REEVPMIGRRRPRIVGILLGSFVVLVRATRAQTPPPAVAAAPSAPAAAWRTFVDVDGKPLPFATDSELLEFLRTPTPTTEKNLSDGFHSPSKVAPEKDGVRANAVFRHVNEPHVRPTTGGGRNEIGFTDSYIYEPAAYELGLMLGLDNVPPATVRKLHGKTG